MSAVICDFGLARVSSDTKVMTQKLVNVKGFSPRYTAPEVFGRVMTSVVLTSVEDEMKGDVYSYAVIIWEIITRKIPWEHCNFLFPSFFSFSFDFNIYIY